MDGRLRILMLEDNPDDADLIKITMRRGGIEFESKVVATRQEFVISLTSFSPDLILSDHQLPQFNSPEALRLSKDLFPTVPFILVTGAVSEEFAASIIRQGADDYLLKGNLKRLCTAIALAIEKKRTEDSLRKTEGERKAAVQELHNAHERLLFHIENTPLGYIEWDSHFSVKSWSKAAEKIFGWTEQEFTANHKNGFGTVYEDDLEWTSKIAEQLLSGQVERNNFQNRNYTKDGRVIWCDWFNSVMKNEDGKVVTIMTLVQDITSRKTFEGILSEYNERYQILSKATNDAIWDWDIEHDFELWNHGIQTIFGYREREISLSKKWWQEKIHPSDLERVNKEISDVFTSKATNWTSQYQYLCADGTYKHVLDRGYVIYSDDRPVRMIGAMQDITAQKNSIEEIEKLSLVASKTSNSVIITDDQDRIEWVNEGFVALSGYSLEEVKGLKPGRVLQGPETDSATRERIRTKISNLETFTEEIINYSKTGRKYWLRMDVSPVFGDGGHLKHFIAIQTDISAQKDYENEITNIARELSSLIENANVPIFGIDRNGRINEWNRIAAELTEYERNEVLEQKFAGLIANEIKRSVLDILTSVFAGESTRNYELPFLSKNGKQLILLISISPRMDVNKKIYGAICVGQGITELFRYRQDLEMIVAERTRELNEALQKEKELVELKSRFVSIASHEFRTPLSTISLAAGMLKKHHKKMSVPELNAKLETIENQVRHMTYLLDDILIIGKADAGKILTNYSSIAIEQFITQVAKEVEQNFATHRIRMSFNCSVRQFNSDEKLMRNIITNLLTNAIKFSHYIKIVELVISNTKDMLRFDVIDKGIGIGEDDLDSIFIAFHRGSNVGTIEGTGLGLSIVKKAVDLLKGEIKVNSKLGKGTTFTVLLPLQT